VDVRQLDGDAWQLKRALRLAALQDSPAAFASTYTRESHRPETEWRVWPAGGAFFAAFAPPAPPAAGEGHCALGIAGARVTAADPSTTHPISMPAPPAAGDGHCALGIAGAWVTAADPSTTHLISMWVAPAARGRRVAAALAGAVAEWAAARGCNTVELEVAAENTAAMHAYLRCGFAVTDREPFSACGVVLTRPV
jgi:ribosomal protein S18 acetylase RimI-like enzyme